MSAILLATLALMSGEAMASIDLSARDIIPGKDSVDQFEGRYIARNPFDKREADATSTVVSATTMESGDSMESSMDMSDSAGSTGLEVSLTSTSIAKETESAATGSEPIVDGGITTIAYSTPSETASGFANAHVSSTAEATETSESTAGEGTAGEGGSGVAEAGGEASDGAPGSANSGNASASESYSDASATETMASGNSTESMSEDTYESYATSLSTIAGNSTGEVTSMDSWNSLPTDVAQPTGNSTASITDAYGGGIVEVNGTTTSDGVVWANNANMASLSIGSALFAFLLL